jgi:hypothetical protein
VSDVELGGETNFPNAVGFQRVQDEAIPDVCHGGLRVKPETGKVGRGSTDALVGLSRVYRCAWG